MTTVTDTSPNGEGKDKDKKSKPEKIKRYDLRFVRNAPVQGRSDARLKALAAAGEKLLQDPRVGTRWITSALVAQEAGSSIGTFYRYFPHINDLIDYVWPNRRDTVMKPKKSKKKAKDKQHKDS